MSADDEFGFQQSKKALKGQKQKAKKEEAALAKSAEPDAPAAAVAAPAQAAGGGYAKQPDAPKAPKPANADGPPATEEEKKAKAIQKKLRQIQDLEAKLEGGEGLNEEQLAKVANKAALQAELKEVSNPKKKAPAASPKQAPAAAPAAPAVEQPVAAAKVPEKAAEAPAPAPAPTPPAPPAPEPAAAQKNLKAIEKKLRQIEELEEKQKGGTTLNEDQLAKLAMKKELQADLKKAKKGK